MRKLIFALVLPLSLGGCLSYVSEPTPPRTTTIVVPPGSTVTCANGLAPPC
jgi:hypothetical protein